jgi:sec-independent protein translocase protein TatC
MKFLLEIKNRVFLIFFVWLSLINICYYYKEILFFLLINVLTQKKNAYDLYFVYTGITELFIVYLRIIQFFTLQVVAWYSFYHLFLFLIPALHKTEYLKLKSLLLLLTSYSIVNFLFVIVVVFPLTWEFFEGFQQLFTVNYSVYFEVKVSEYFQFFFSTYFFIQYYSLSFIVFIFVFQDFYYNKIYTKKFRKLNYFIFLFVFTFINSSDILCQILFSFILCFFYEFSLFFHIFKTCLHFKSYNHILGTNP